MTSAISMAFPIAPHSVELNPYMRGLRAPASISTALLTVFSRVSSFPLIVGDVIRFSWWFMNFDLDMVQAFFTLSI